MNLVDQIKQQFTGDVARQISEQLGESPDKVRTGLSAAIPALLASITQTASEPGGAGRLMDSMRDNESLASGSLLDTLRGAEGGSLMQKGSNLLSSLFSGQTSEGLAQAISQFSGLNTGTTKNLISMVLPLILGKIGLSARNAGVTDASGLTGFLSSQASNISAALPGGLKEKLAAIPGIGSITEAFRGAPARERAAEPVEHRELVGAGRDKGSTTEWAIPAAVILILLIGLGYWLWRWGKPGKPEFAGGTASTTQPAEESGAGAESPARITGGVIGDTPDQASNAGQRWLGDLGALANTRLGGEMKSLFSDLSTTLSSVRDASSAQAAGDSLRDISQRLDTWETSAAGLPPEQQQQFQQALERALPSVEAAAQRASQAPGGEEHVKPITDQIIQKLRGLAEVSQTATQPAGI